MSSPEAQIEERGYEQLPGVARAAIEHGLRRGTEWGLDPDLYPGALRKPGASFVTLRREGRLRGCTGSLEPHLPLVRDVARNAHRSAFGDPRFPLLAADELEDLEIHVSVLGPLVALTAASEPELLAQLRPGIDGLVLREGAACATFLPAVWSSLPEPGQFLEQLRLKAGLPRDHWSPRLRFQRYAVEEFS